MNPLLLFCVDFAFLSLYTLQMYQIVKWITPVWFESVEYLAYTAATV